MKQSRNRPVLKYKKKDMLAGLPFFIAPLKPPTKTKNTLLLPHIHTHIKQTQEVTRDTTKAISCLESF